MHPERVWSKRVWGFGKAPEEQKKRVPRLHVEDGGRGCFIIRSQRRPALWRWSSRSLRVFLFTPISFQFSSCTLSLCSGRHSIRVPTLLGPGLRLPEHAVISKEDPVAQGRWLVIGEAIHKKVARVPSIKFLQAQVQQARRAATTYVLLIFTNPT